MSEKKMKLYVICLMIVGSIFLVSSVDAVPVKIMPLGDSITGSPGCWRALLWQSLRGNGYTNIDFVGTLPDPGCGITYDGDNEGHGGFLATGIVADNQLPGWLAATTPDIVMMMLGTNDTWSSKGTSVILDAFTTLVGQMRASNPDMKILVAQLTPNNYSGCTQCTPNIIDLNAAIPGWAADHYTSRSPIVVVDQFTGYNTETDTYDGCHPNDSGNVKIAARWFPALASYLDGIIPTPGPTSVPTPAPTPIDCSNAREWNATAVYETTGTKVVYNGILYQNNWYSSGQNPEENSDPNEVWTRIGPCGTQTTRTPTPVPTPTSHITRGDVNTDGRIDIVDALMVAQYYVGLNVSGFNPAVADADCNGNIDIIDALIIAQYYVGLISQFC